jgi:hypothetical protein
MRSRGSVSDAKIVAVPSVEPSSMTMSSRSPKLCARTLTIASRRYCARLYVGMSTETVGEFMRKRTPV